MGSWRRSSSSAWWFLVTYAVVFVERGQRKILVNYAKRQVGNKVYGGQSSHLPLKLNMSGVIRRSLRRRSSCLPTTIVNWFASGDDTLAQGSGVCCEPRSADLRVAVFGCHRFLLLLLRRWSSNSRETAEQPEKSGAFIPGIRPGDQTAKHIDKILSRLTRRRRLHHPGVPAARVPHAQVQRAVLFRWHFAPAHHRGRHDGLLGARCRLCMSQQYESLLKKANFKVELSEPDFHPIQSTPNRRHGERRRHSNAGRDS